MNSKELTWTCHICKRERPDYCINVYRRERKINGVPFTQNIRYCNDNPECLEGAKLIPSPIDDSHPRPGEGDLSRYMRRVSELRAEVKRLNDQYETLLATWERQLDELCELHEKYEKPAYGIDAYYRMGVAWKMFWRSFRNWFRG